MTRSKGVFCSGNKDGVLKSFHAKTASVADMTAALEACETFCMSDAACQACSVDQYMQNSFQWSAIPTCGVLSVWPGAISGDVSMKKSAGQVTITLSGPADRWFAVGAGHRGAAAWRGLATFKFDIQNAMTFDGPGVFKTCFTQLSPCCNWCNCHTAGSSRYGTRDCHTACDWTPLLRGCK